MWYMQIHHYYKILKYVERKLGVLGIIEIKEAMRQGRLPIPTCGRIVVELSIAAGIKGIPCFIAFHFYDPYLNLMFRRVCRDVVLILHTHISYTIIHTPLIELSSLQSAVLVQ